MCVVGSVQDLAMRCADPETRKELLERAYMGYHRSYEGHGKTSYYTGINTATMAMLLGREVEAVVRAQEVRLATPAHPFHPLARQAVTCLRCPSRALLVFFGSGGGAV